MSISSGEAEEGALEAFDAIWYAAEYPDVEILRMDPAEHYEWIGRRLGRRGSPCVADANAKREEIGEFPLPTINGQDSPIGLLLDRDWYRENYLDAGCLASPEDHYRSIGAGLGYDPNPYFDVKWYLTKYPDVAAAGANPVEHYFRFGASEGRNPGPNFDTRFYAMQMDKSDDLSGELLLHFLKVGRHEGKLPHASAIRKELADDALGAGLPIRPTSVTIGIVAYKQTSAEIANLVHSIDKAAAAAGEDVRSSIVIFDNGLSLRRGQVPAHVDLMSNGRNDGFGRAHNRIMERAFGSGSDSYVGVNPDGVLHRDCLANLIRMSQRHGGRALIEALQFPEEHPKFYHPETMECDWISGACFLISKEVWTAIKGFDENIFLYCEDVDLSWSARRCGYKTLTCPSALFYHDVSDRPYSEHVWREMLLAGRYLGHKWQSPTFLKKMERELLSGGLVKRKSALPKLDEADVLRNATEHANFGKMFSFTNTRW